MLESRLSSSFPQVFKALFFATIQVTVATAWRSFSVFFEAQIDKDIFEVSTAQERLLDASILPIRNEEVRSIDKVQLIDTFARMNARRYKHVFEHLPVI